MGRMEKSFEHQTGSTLKLCSGSDVNKDANCGVLQKDGDVLPYTVSWRQQYYCFRGGQPRYKRNDNKNHEMLKVVWMPS